MFSTTFTNENQRSVFGKTNREVLHKNKTVTATNRFKNVGGSVDEETKRKSYKNENVKVEDVCRIELGTDTSRGVLVVRIEMVRACRVEKYNDAMIAKEIGGIKE